MKVDGLLAAVVFASASAMGEPSAVRVAESLSAHPDNPEFGLIYRKGARVVLGAVIPVLGAAPDARFGLRVTPMVELHNHPSSELVVVPNENWRGRLSSEIWRLWPIPSGHGRGAWFRLGLAFEHESDHASVRLHEPVYGFRQLNDVAVRTTIGTDPGARWVATGELANRLYMFSCTSPEIDCLGHWDVSYGGSTDFVLQSPWHLARSWRAYGAVSFSWIAPAGQVISEWRASAHLGLWSRGWAGMWQAFLLGYAGHDVGIGREKTVHQLGFGVRWSP
jgi:hypothetical protein